MSTRRGSGEGSIYQRADGRWVAALDLGKDDNEKRQRKVLYGRTRADVRSKLLQAQREHDERRLALASPTVQDWLRHYLDHIATNRPSTLKTYRSYAEKHIIPAVGSRRLDRLTQADVRRMLVAMRADGKSDATVRQVFAILARSLVIAQREGKVSANVCDKHHMQAPDVGDNPRTPLSVTDAKRVLAAAAGDPFESRWYAALYLGLRQGEALGLQWRDVDLANESLFVHQALQRVQGKGLVLVEPKSKASTRVIPLARVIASRLAVDRAKHIAANGSPDDFVWTYDGKPIDASADLKRWKALLERAGVPYVALHAARNTTGRLLMEAGVPDTIAKEILGHSSVRVTQRHYQRGDVEQRRAALEAVQSLIER